MIVRAIGVDVLDRARQASVGAIVLGLHVMGVLLWSTMGSEMHAVRRDAAIALVTVWLPEQATPSKDPAKSADRSPAARSDPSHRDNSESSELFAPAALSTLPTAGAQATLEGPTTPAPPLNLTLSRKDMTTLVAPSFADKSQFHAPLPKTVERKIAEVFADSGPWTEERVDIDHIRFRRGNTCVMMERPAAAKLFPFDEASSRIPWRANTYRCPGS